LLIIAHLAIIITENWQNRLNFDAEAKFTTNQAIYQRICITFQ